MRYLEEYYNNYDEEGRLFSRHGLVEYLTTMRYIEECLEGISDPSICDYAYPIESVKQVTAKNWKEIRIDRFSERIELQHSFFDGVL